MAYPAAELREYLVDEGFVRKPSGTGDEPVCYVDPRGGTPYGPDTNTGATCTVGLSEDGGLPTRGGLGAVEKVLIRVDIRSVDAKEGADLARAIVNDLDDRQQVQLGDMRAEWVSVYQRPQFVFTGSETSQGYIRTMVLMLTLHKSELG